MSKNPTSPLNRVARMLDLVPYLHAHQGKARTMALVFHKHIRQKLLPEFLERGFSFRFYAISIAAFLDAVIL